MINQGRQWESLLLVALAGGIGGAINAWLCLARLPVPVYDDPEFRWVIVPGGMLHGACLAVIAFIGALATSVLRPLPRLAMVVPIGWVSGYLSWIPLNHWVFKETWGNSLIWVFRDNSLGAVLWGPYVQFGLVSALYFLGLSFGCQRRRRLTCIFYGVCAGVLGSLWWWVEFKPWYIALIHGTIWGLFVSMGVTRSFKSWTSSEPIVT